MTDPFMVSVASALATKAADMAAEGVRSAMGALMRLVRSRFAGDKAAEAALDAAQAAPRHQAAVQELARVLELAAAADADFAAQVRALWPELQAGLSARDGGTVNSSTGTVGGHLIQARDLHVEGGLSLGNVQGRCP
ncbi:MAG TPA: hypothetical protein VFQ44_04175 [Streptosporangiaceae bacterium]|nr:hypothetical protein [Streptosporangiaceae bacterium]